MKLPAFFRKSPVLCISAAFTLLSMLWVPPDRGYLDYLDFQVLCLLFCLMAVIQGFDSLLMFQRLPVGCWLGFTPCADYTWCWFFCPFSVPCF